MPPSLASACGALWRRPEAAAYVAKVLHIVAVRWLKRGGVPHRFPPCHHIEWS